MGGEPYFHRIISIGPGGVMLQSFGLLRHEGHKFEGAFEIWEFKFAIQLLVLFLPHGVILRRRAGNSSHWTLRCGNIAFPFEWWPDNDHIDQPLMLG